MEVDPKIVGSNIQPMSYTTIHYVWDGINYVEGRGIKYAHPDYNKPYPNSNYYIEPWDNVSFTETDFTIYI